MVEWTTMSVPKAEKEALDKLKPEDTPHYKHYRRLIDGEATTDVGELTVTVEDMRPMVREEVESALSEIDVGVTLDDIDVPAGLSPNEVREIVRDEARKAIRDELR